MPSGLTSLLWFFAIVAMIPLALWLLKRTPMGGAGLPGVVRTVAALPLSPSQRVVTVEVGTGADRRWLVLGVTPQQITTLHTMAPQPEAELASAAASAHAATPFAQLLSRFGGRSQAATPTQGEPHGR
jgi:flagellar protein FliO/FliZ